MSESLQYKKKKALNSLSLEGQIDELLEKILELQAFKEEVSQFLDLSKKEKKAVARQRKAASGVMFVPELDYLVHVTKMRREFRHGSVDTMGRSHMLTAPPVMYGHWLEGRHGTEILIPSPLVRRDITGKYHAVYKVDYRTQKTRSAYMKGVLSGYPSQGNGEDHVSGTTAVQVFAWSTEITSEVIQNTRNYWKAMSKEEEEGRICSRYTMLKLCDLMEERKLEPGSIPWVVEEASDSFQPELAPNKITIDDAYLRNQVDYDKENEKLLKSLNKDTTIDEDEEMWADWQRTQKEEE